MWICSRRGLQAATSMQDTGTAWILRTMKQMERPSFFNSNKARIWVKFIPFTSNKWTNIVWYKNLCDYLYISVYYESPTVIKFCTPCRGMSMYTWKKTPRKGSKNKAQGTAWKSCKLSCIQKWSAKLHEAVPSYRPAAFRNLSYGLAGGSLNEQSDSLDNESLRRMRPFLVDCISGSDRRDDCNTWQLMRVMLRSEQHFPHGKKKQIWNLNEWYVWWLYFEDIHASFISSPSTLVEPWESALECL